MVVHMKLTNEGLKSRRYEVIMLTSHFGFCDMKIRLMSLNIELDLDPYNAELFM